MTTHKPPPEVNCPVCGTIAIWSETNEYRPFCSKRCRLIDLGEWLNESNRIPSEESIPPANESSDGES